MIAAGILLAVMTFSSLIHIVEMDVKLEQQLTDNKILQPQNGMDWQPILMQMSQFQTKLETKAPVIKDVQVKISDATLIAVIADNPQSAIILIPEENEQPRQLSIGEGWLNQWIIKQITADAVIWENNGNNETYTQWLFASTATQGSDKLSDTSEKAKKSKKSGN